MMPVTTLLAWTPIKAQKPTSGKLVLIYSDERNGSRSIELALYHAAGEEGSFEAWVTGEEVEWEPTYWAEFKVPGDLE